MKDRQFAIALAIIVPFVGMVCSLAFIELPESSREIFRDIVQFYLVGAIPGVVNFYFGSSKGSQRKDELIHGKGETQEPKKDSEASKLPVKEVERLTASVGRTESK